MKTFVLVHGMWHGGWCWKRVKPLLAAAGCDVFAPTLTGLGKRSHFRSGTISWSTHVQDIVNLLQYEDLQDVVLVGHSYAGGLALEVADHVPERIAQLVCLDSLIPPHGKSFREQFPNFYADLQRRIDMQDGIAWIVPPEWAFGITDPAELAWLRSKLVSHPLATIEAPVSFCNPAALALPRVYVSCTAEKDAAAIVTEEKKWTGRGWQYRTLHAGHDAMITEPEKLTELLLKFH